MRLKETIGPDTRTPDTFHGVIPQEILDEFRVPHELLHPRSFLDLFTGLEVNGLGFKELGLAGGKHGVLHKYEDGPDMIISVVDEHDARENGDVYRHAYSLIYRPGDTFVYAEKHRELQHANRQKLEVETLDEDNLQKVLLLITRLVVDSTESPQN